MPLRRNWADPQVDVTVIVPCYKVEKFVRECIQSALDQQTAASFEVLAIDDGSPDSTGAILDEMAAKDARICVIHQENRGFSGARNVGIDHARGRYLMFLDSDDRLRPNAMQALLDRIRQSDVDVVSANYARVSEDGSSVTEPTSPRSHGAPWGRIFKRQVFQHLDFPEGLWFEDTLQAYCIDPVFKSAYLEQVVYEWRTNANSITHTCAASKKGADTHWVVEALLGWCKQLGIKPSQELYDQTLRQFGPLYLGRTAALSPTELEAAFSLACDLLADDYFTGYSTSMSPRWKELESALRTRDFAQWKLAASTL